MRRPSRDQKFSIGVHLRVGNQSETCLKHYRRMVAFVILVVEEMLFGLEIVLQDIDARIKLFDSTPMQYKISRIVNNLIQIFRVRSTKGCVNNCAYMGDVAI